MVPISEYATVVVGTPLIDAIRALEQAQEAYTTSKYQHQAILVLDTNGDVVGKISQLRALKAIEPEFDFNGQIKEMQKLNFSESYIAKLRDQLRSQGEIIQRETLQKAATTKVEDFMQSHSFGEYVDEECRLDTAIHKLVAGTHLSLLVTRGEEITGILRIADVFAAIFHEMMEINH